MPRKVFLSFLGALPYNMVNYTYNDKSYLTPYAPVAALQALQEQREWIPESVFFFLTDAAKKAHWSAYTHTNRDKTTENRVGLAQTITDVCGNAPQYKPIGNGETEAEIWEIFRTMMDCIAENDEIVLDVTLGFRVSPMLMLAFVDYAHFLKNVSVKAIFYSAYQPWVDDKNAQLWDMISFVELQRWTRAADFFINTGNATELATILKENDDYTDIAKKVEAVSLQFQTVRGKSIIQAKTINELSEKINLHNNSTENKPVKDLLNAISVKIKDFKMNDTANNEFKTLVNNALMSVKWCIDHNLTQQGFTLLQENIITIVLHKIGKTTTEDTWRSAASAAFTCHRNTEDKWHGKDDHKTKIKALLDANKDLFELFNPEKKQSEVLQNKQLYSRISDCRNSMNHGGFTDNKEAKTMHTQLIDYYNITTIICNSLTPEKVEEEKI